MKIVIDTSTLDLSEGVTDLYIRHRIERSHFERWWLLPDRDAVLVLSVTPKNSDPLNITIMPGEEAVRQFRLLTRPVEGWAVNQVSPEMKAALTEWHESFPPKPGDDDEKIITLPLSDRRCYFVQETERTKDGWIVCIAVEGESGFYRSNWRWDCSFKDAEAMCQQKNEALGISQSDAILIVLGSMRSELSHAW